MSFSRRSLLSAAVALAAVLGAATIASQAHAQQKKELVIGATAGSNLDVLKLGIKPQLEQKGYKVKLVEFNDYVQPNKALADGALDANFFQHIIYLKKFAADQKLDIVDIVQGPIAPLGLYSRKFKTVADVREGARIALPNDPTNLARSLVFLEQHKLLTVKPGVDPLRVTEKDIVANPKKIQLVPLEAAQLPRALDDTDFAIVNGNFAIASGLKLTEAVALEKTPDYYLLVAAVKRADAGTPWAHDIAEAFKTPFFKQVLDKNFAGYARPSFLQ
ncbi:MetQ/NlpA family ABC transporter substrate-binding protein [Rubrivivax gelatinosus]|uniref:MetQ/NlpA family ABC transporter substrate-binding protein n=1 Tax=Rubrivivax gelatinosus TaxID=28068 RepID=UPI0002FDE32E|nr:MetQ/NlpA family ABC transporter substrate-binding protein [Rubrivivax gelatinosus]MBG6081966.1 D-methionine transport system substrate-binding protein [Rubrivivax gelatinosus]